MTHLCILNHSSCCYFAREAVAKYCDEHICLCVCLSARISPEPHTQSLRHFLCMLPMAVAQSSSRATKSQEEGEILGVFLPLTMHRNAFAAIGIIQLPITSCSRRDYSVAAVFAAKGISLLARKGWWDCTLWARCQQLPCLKYASMQMKTASVRPR